MTRTDPKKYDKVGLAIGLVVLTISIVIQALALVDVHEGRSSRKWPATRATLGRYHIKRHHSGSRKHRKIRYRVHFHYTYTVDNQRYESTRFRVGDKYWHRSKTRKAAKGWAKGYLDAHPTLQVYYDPQQPDSAVVERGVSSTVLFGVYFVPIFAGVGWIFAVSSRPKRFQLKGPKLYGSAALLVVALWLLATIVMLLI